MTADWPSTTYVAADTVLIVDQLDRCQAPLLAAEAELACGVTGARLRELRAGRNSARNALQRLGIDPAPILSTPAGVPIWPTGLCGSLSHSHRYVAVLLAHSSQYESVGIDIEDGRPLGAASEGVVTAPELEVIRQAGLTGAGITAEGIAFSAKEAVFKCQFPLTLDSSLDFLDVRLEPGRLPRSLGIQMASSDRTILAELAKRIHIHVLSILSVTVVYAAVRR